MMKRHLTVVVVAASLATATMATPTPAHARWGWGWGLGAFALGAFIGAALTRPAYAYGYYPAYSYGYGYPAYSYGYAYPIDRTATVDIMAVTGLTTGLPSMEVIVSLGGSRSIALAGTDAALAQID